MSRRVASLSAPKRRSWSTAICTDATIQPYGCMAPSCQIFFGALSELHTVARATGPPRSGQTIVWTGGDASAVPGGHRPGDRVQRAARAALAADVRLTA